MMTSRAGTLSTRSKSNLILMDSIVFVLIAAAIMGIGLSMATSTLASQGVYLAGTLANGVDVSGLTPQQALDKLLVLETEKNEKTKIAVMCAQTTQVFTTRDAGVTSAAKQVFEQALALLDPQESSSWQRMVQLYKLRDEGITADISVTYSRDILERAVASFAAPFDVDYLDAKATFDFEAETFHYVQERPRSFIDQTWLTDTLLKQFEAGDSTPIEVVPLQQPAFITLEALKRNTRLIGSCVTELNDNEDRNQNIQLITDALNGTVLQAGEQFSINEMTGRRTAEKGYLPAKAIVYGQYVDEYGGGVCQLTGTLYNAALLAGANILQRSSHSIPSSYLPMGLDSTVDYDSGKDLVIQNNSPYPMYFSARIHGMDLVVRIYGGYPEENLRYELETETISTIKPSKPVVIYDSTLPKGRRVLVNPARDGYEVKSYRLVYRDGALEDKVLLASDYFEPKPVTYREGTKEADGVATQEKD